ncbi:hypothetical protein XI09_03305 [Bradyrhizobium sp. CCBAU 11386]|nr:hypothetical protein [Bradyrhizobium sp. CCBAU 11386]
MLNVFIFGSTYLLVGPQTLSLRGRVGSALPYRRPALLRFMRLLLRTKFGSASVFQLTERYLRPALMLYELS